MILLRLLISQDENVGGNNAAIYIYKLSFYLEFRAQVFCFILFGQRDFILFRKAKKVGSRKRRVSPAR